MNQTLPIPLNQLRLQLQRIPVAFVRGLVNVAFVLILAWFLAKLSWQLIPKPEHELTLSSLPPALQSPSTQDFSALARYPFFGKAEPKAAAAPVVVTEAPKTQLNVKLTGLVSVTARPESGSAVIEHRGNEATYAVGDTLEGTRARLHQVLEDRVLLELNGRFETLMLDGVEFTRIAQANAGLGREDSVEAEFVQEPILIAAPIATGLDNPDLQTQRDEILAEPMKFFDYVRVTPEQRDGQLVGYKLMPRKDAALFRQLGLQPGDLAIEINGVPLSDIQQAARIINDLRDASEAAIKIERDGEIRDILFSLSQ